jgi:hypothetical protein
VVEEDKEGIGDKREGKDFVDVGGTSLGEKKREEIGQERIRARRGMADYGPVQG